MDDVRNIVYDTMFYQILKLLDPTSNQFQMESSDKMEEPLFVGDNEIAALGNRTVQMVMSGIWPLRKLQGMSTDIREINNNILYPAIFQSLGDETQSEEPAARELGTPTYKDNFNIVSQIIVAVDNPDPYNYQNSAPKQLLRIRQQLDYVLNRQNFTMIQTFDADDPYPSKVQKARLFKGKPKFMNMISSVELLELTFEVEIERPTLPTELT